MHPFGDFSARLRCAPPSLVPRAGGALIDTCRPLTFVVTLAAPPRGLFPRSSRQRAPFGAALRKPPGPGARARVRVRKAHRRSRRPFVVSPLRNEPEVEASRDPVRISARPAYPSRAPSPAAASTEAAGSVAPGCAPPTSKMPSFGNPRHGRPTHATHDFRERAPVSVRLSASRKSPCADR